MRINKLYEKSKTEDKFFEPFLQFYISNFLPDLKASQIQLDSPDQKSGKGSRPDYYVEQLQMLAEVAEVHDRTEREVSIAWGQNIKRLCQNAEKDPRKERILGTYLVDTPQDFRIERGDENQIIDAIFGAIFGNQDTVSVLEHTLKVHKASEHGASIHFGTSSDVKFINPAKTIYDNVLKKITTANKQLSFTPKGEKVDKRILLLVNKYIHGDRINEHIQALSYAYIKLLTYRNIDEIWLQLETTDGSFVHVLLHTKLFLEEFEREKLCDTKENAELFENWFSSLDKLSDEYKNKLFIGLKVFLEERKPSQVFGNSCGKSAREEMVRLGIWLAEKKRFDDAAWIIDKFIDDPDPAEPEDYKGDPKFNYHQRIVNGEDPNIITTVRGHLAWVVQKLALHKEHIIKAFDYTKTLFQYKNLYAKLQAIIPLTEISARRQWLGEQSPQKYQEFHDLVFDVLRKYSEYRAVAKWLTHVFYYFKDLTTEEAMEVLEKLKITNEAAALFIYFGIFRERHYKNPDGTDKKGFDPQPLKKQLEEMIKNNEDQYVNLRASIAWNFWKILNDDLKEFDTLSSYIDLFLEQPYRKNVYDDIERIIKEWIEQRPEKCISWFEQLLDKIAAYINTHQHEGRNIWLRTEKIVGYLARYRPEKLVNLMGRLVDLWIQGAYIGSPKALFESYKAVSEKGLQENTKKEFQGLYKRMKKLNPKTEEVEWD